MHYTYIRMYILKVHLPVRYIYIIYLFVLHVMLADSTDGDTTEQPDEGKIIML